jgi:hypothetical protein
VTSGLRRWRPAAAAVTVAAALVATAASCTHDGRALRPPAPGAVAPTTASTTTTSTPPPQIGTQPTLRMVSPSFLDGGALPARYTCEGAKLSPPFQWAGVPEGTVELALVAMDREAGFVHWVVAGLDPLLVGLGDGSVPESAVEAQNSEGGAGYSPPCPDPKGPVHHYDFTLYALHTASGIHSDTTAADARAAIQADATQEASMSAVFPGP